MILRAGVPPTPVSNLPILIQGAHSQHGPRSTFTRWHARFRSSTNADASDDHCAFEREVIVCSYYVDNSNLLNI